MSVYTEHDVRNACEALGMEYAEIYESKNVRRVGIRVGIYAREMLLHSETVAEIVDSATEAVRDARNIKSYLEQEYKRHDEPLPPEPDCWNPWPDSAPPEDVPCIVKFECNFQPKILIGRYHPEFSLWAFTDLDNRTLSFTDSDLSISNVFYKPLNLCTHSLIASEDRDASSSAYGLTSSATPSAAPVPDSNSLERMASSGRP